MRSKNKRILNISLVAITAAIAILGTTLMLTMPVSGYAGFGGLWRAHHGWIQNGDPGAAASPGTVPDSNPGVSNPETVLPNNQDRFGPWGTDPRMMMGPPSFGYSGFGHPGMIGHGFGFLFFISAIVLTIILVGRRRQFGREDNLTAEEILRRRFADGSISVEEYQSRLNTLKGKGE